MLTLPSKCKLRNFATCNKEQIKTYADVIHPALLKFSVAGDGLLSMGLCLFLFGANSDLKSK